MAPNQPPNQPSPLDGEEDRSPNAPQAHGASAAPPPYGRPPGEYGQGTGNDGGAPVSGERQQSGYPQGGYTQEGYPQPGYSQGGYQQPGYSQGGQSYYQQGPPPGTYQQGYAQGYPPGYPTPYGWAEPKSRLAAGLLGIFLGGLGIQRFYLGYTTLGIVQLLVTIFTFGFGAIWGFVEGIMILAGAQSFRTDARGVPLRE